MNLDQLKQRIDLHDLAQKLGLHRAKSGNYRAPWRKDKKASLSIFQHNGTKRWKDHGSDKSGTAIDLVMETLGQDLPQAVQTLHDLYGWEQDLPSKTTTGKESTAAYLWRLARNHKDFLKAADYLQINRHLPAEQVEQWQGRLFGYTDYRPADNDATGYGPAVVFPVIDSNGQLQALNLRYLEPDHEPKMRMIGPAEGGLFAPHWPLRSPRIWLVESPIDALTLTAAGCPALAYLSANLARSFPLTWITDRQQILIWPDSDSQGRHAADTLYHRLISAGITAQLINVEKNSPHCKDANDVLRKNSWEEVKNFANQSDFQLFPCSIPWLPPSEFSFVQALRCSVDYVECEKRTDDSVETVPVTGFRVYRIDPITVHDPRSALGNTGGGYAATQSLIIYRRAESSLMQRRIMDADDIARPETWKKIGWVHNPYYLARMIQALSRDQRHEHETVNVVGLVQLGQRVQLNDASNTYLNHEDCIYHRLRIPTAPQAQAGQHLQKLSKLFKDEKALIGFTWLAGGFLKVFLGFWPHLIISAHSSSGKTTLIEALQTLTSAMNVEPSELETGYRRMRITGNHCYPVLCDEFSRANPRNVSEFLDILNVSYRYALRHHGRERVYFLAAPVALIGQDAPTEDAAFLSKVLQFDLDHAKGELQRFDGPFPMREFAAWLSSRLTRENATQRLDQHQDRLISKLNTTANSGNITRLVANYAALLLAFEELSEFAGYDNRAFFPAVVDMLHRHLADTAMTRRESVAILDRLAREIVIDPKGAPPFRIEDEDVIIPPASILDYLHARGHHFPVTSVRRLIDHLSHDGFLVARNLQRSIYGQKYSSCVRLSLSKLNDAGVDWPLPV